MKTQFFNRTEAGQFLAGKSQRLRESGRRAGARAAARWRAGCGGSGQKTERATRRVCCSQTRFAWSPGIGHGCDRFWWRACIQRRRREFAAEFQTR